MQPGELIAGKYRIDRILGQGGMGTVAAATNVMIDQRVALKFLLPELLGDATVVERLLREARAAAKLRSEHVCLVYDVGNDRGEPFIVMELLEGRDLASMVSTHVVMPVRQATDYMLQVATGLAEAHAHGIVHRDLKPANLFLTKRLDGSPLIKILDFGIAKAPTDKQFHLTRTAAVMGSPGYMSPEQLRSTRDADPRSDIWALGVILFELTAGRPPFLAESITELALKVGMDPMPAIPGVPREFERVVSRCLEKDPNRRFADVGQLAAALAPFGSKGAMVVASAIARMLHVVPPLHAVTSSPELPSSSVPVDMVDTASTTLGASASVRLNTSSRRSRGLLAGFAVVVAAVAAIMTIRSGSNASAVQPPIAEAPAPNIPLDVSPAPSSVNPGATITPLDTAASANDSPSVTSTKPPEPATIESALPNVPSRASEEPTPRAPVAASAMTAQSSDETAVTMPTTATPKSDSIRPSPAVTSSKRMRAGDTKAAKAPKRAPLAATSLPTVRAAVSVPADAGAVVPKSTMAMPVKSAETPAVPKPVPVKDVGESRE